MTAPIDISCPTCKALPGRKCTNTAVRIIDEGAPWSFSEEQIVALHFHHAERVDAAMRTLAASDVAPDGITLLCRSCRRLVVVNQVTCGECTKTANDRLRDALKEALSAWADHAHVAANPRVIDSSNAEYVGHVKRQLLRIEQLHELLKT